MVESVTGAAAATKRIAPSMLLVEINRQNVRHMNFKATMAIMKQAQRPLLLRFKLQIDEHTPGHAAAPVNANASSRGTAPVADPAAVPAAACRLKLQMHKTGKAGNLPTA